LKGQEEEKGLAWQWFGTYAR